MIWKPKWAAIPTTEIPEAVSDSDEYPEGAARPQQRNPPTY